MSTWQDRLAEQDKTLHVHLIGIGGAGLSPIAKVLLELGFSVSGSDRQSNANTKLLAELGATIFTQQVAENINNLLAQSGLEQANNIAQSGLEQANYIVLYSSAIAADHSERLAAVAHGISVVKRDEFLPALLSKRKLIAVAGTHGKSTTTSMIVKVLLEAGIDTGYIIGTTLPGYGNASAGSSSYFVLEADEYDHMFLGLQPTVSVITNVEWDHPDCFPTAQSFEDAFHQFAAKEAALTISCLDDAGAEKLRTSIDSNAPWFTYSVQQPDQEKAADLTARVERAAPGEKTSTVLTIAGQQVGVLQLGVPGDHNLRNALAAISVSQWCGVSIAQACRSLRTFNGTARRFETKGEAAGVIVIDDYAHHPTEVRATLDAARNHYPTRRIWAVFQPHTFSRTKQLQAAMSASFSDADQVLVTDIFAAREEDLGEVSAEDIVRQSSHQSIRHTPTLADATAILRNEVAENDVVITLGAGDSYRIGEMLLDELRR